MLARSHNILIVSLRRSGGKLLRRLLDGHPEIMALPFEHWHTPKKGRFPGSIIARFGSLSVEEKLAAIGMERAAQRIEHAKKIKARTLFMECLAKDAELCATPADLYERFVEKYCEQFFGVGPGSRIVNHCGNLALMTAAEIDQVFGPSTKIHLWRDPRGAYVSSQAAKIVNRKSFTGAELDELCRNYEVAFSHHSQTQSICLRFEDLVSDSESEMRALASAIGIDFDDVLLTPTVLGRARHANSAFERPRSGVHAQAAFDWKTRIDPKERELIEKRLGHIIDKMGWENTESEIGGARSGGGGEDPASAHCWRIA